METRGWTFLFVGLTFALYLTIAWISRVRDTRGFYVAGRGVPAPPAVTGEDGLRNLEVALRCLGEG